MTRTMHCAKSVHGWICPIGGSVYALCMCMCVCMCVYICVHVCVYVCVCHCVCVLN